MKMILRVAVILGLVITLFLSDVPISAAPPNNLPKFAADHILVKFKTGINALSMQPANDRHGGSIIKQISSLNVQVVEVPAGQVNEQIKAYQNDSTVEYAEPDYLVQAFGASDDPYFSQHGVWPKYKLRTPGI